MTYKRVYAYNLKGIGITAGTQDLSFMSQAVFQRSIISNKWSNLNGKTI